MWRVSGKYCPKCGPLTPHGWHGNSRGRDGGILGLPLWGDGLYLSVELDALQEKKTTSSWAAVMAINAPSVDVWTRASNLFAIEVGVSPERASGAGEGEHGQGDGDGHVHADLHTWIILFSHFCLYKSAHSHPYSSKTSEQSSSRRWHYYEEVDDDCLMVTGKRKKKQFTFWLVLGCDYAIFSATRREINQENEGCHQGNIFHLSIVGRMNEEPSSTRNWISANKN